jgi:hypothetical protein
MIRHHDEGATRGEHPFDPQTRPRRRDDQPGAEVGDGVYAGGINDGDCENGEQDHHEHQQGEGAEDGGAEDAGEDSQEPGSRSQRTMSVLTGLAPSWRNIAITCPRWYVPWFDTCCASFQSGDSKRRPSNVA